MTELTEPELACLKRIVADQSALFPPCALPVLDRLESLGLIERASYIWLPLEMRRTQYRLTAAGQAVLRGA